MDLTASSFRTDVELQMISMYGLFCSYTAKHNKEIKKKTCLPPLQVSLQPMHTRMYLPITKMTT